MGLEIHAQLDIPTKLFSNAPSTTTTNTSSPPNSALHPFDLATPGFLPQLSKSAVQAAVLASASLNCDIQSESRFERKHYSYADLAHSYQITQQRWPLAVNGTVTCTVANKQGKKKTNEVIACRIDRIQLECDTAKTIVSTADIHFSLLDFSRAGCALIEIVTHPDLRSSQQTAAVVAHIRQVLQHINVCQGKMEMGQFRVDVNVNLERLSDKQRSPRVEVKNLNSIQQVIRATNYEAMRQASVFEKELCRQETRTWDVLASRTKLIRVKDAEDDYRFLPEPDLPPLVLNTECFGGLSLERFINSNLPELPSVAIQRLQDAYGISSYQANVIANDPPAIQFIDEAMKQAPPGHVRDFAKIVGNLLCNELFALVKSVANFDEDDASISYSTVSAHHLGELAMMQHTGIVSNTMAKKILAFMFHSDEGVAPNQVAEKHGFRLISDPETLLRLCRDVIADHPEELDVYRHGGKYVTKMTKLFTGKVMAVCNGNAHPERLQEAVEQALESASSEKEV